MLSHGLTANTQIVHTLVRSQECTLACQQLERYFKTNSLRNSVPDFLALHDTKVRREEPGRGTCQENYYKTLQSSSRSTISVNQMWTMPQMVQNTHGVSYVHNVTFWGRFSQSSNVSLSHGHVSNDHLTAITKLKLFNF